MKLLDLFCGAGGCSVGYMRAGFEVTAIDIAPMPSNPADELIQGDAMLYLADVDFLNCFDAVHTSPPCQAYTALRTRQGGKAYPELVTPVRDALRRWGGPYVIENVNGSPLTGVVLCGSMFGLGNEERILKRHRIFESNVPLVQPKDKCAGKPVVGVYGTGGAWTRTAPGGGGVKASGAAAARIMGIDWTIDQKVLSQAIPPVYTEFIGRQILNQLVAA